VSSRAHSEEFRGLFAEEARERLAALEAAALACVAGDTDPVHLDTMHREAHTLKGGAAVVGYEDVAVLLAGLEADLRALKEAGSPATPETGNAALAAAATVREHVDAELANG
jgi:two-component system chemotaxis sensor kinase CheA